MGEEDRKSLHTYVYVYACMEVRGQPPRSFLRCHPPSFVSQGLLLAWNSTLVQVGWQRARETCFIPPSQLWDFYMCSEKQTQVLMLVRPTFYWLSCLCKLNHIFWQDLITFSNDISKTNRNLL